MSGAQPGNLASPSCAYWSDTTNRHRGDSRRGRRTGAHGQRRPPAARIDDGATTRGTSERMGQTAGTAGGPAQGPVRSGSGLGRIRGAGLPGAVRRQQSHDIRRQHQRAATGGAGGQRYTGRHSAGDPAWPRSVIVAGSLTKGFAILAEAGLSFLGVGVRPPTPTWGGMLRDAFQFIYLAPWLSFFPGVAIFVLVLSLNLLGDGLRDALDPRLCAAPSPSADSASVDLGEHAAASWP